MDLATDRVLVTGADGWLGRGLLHALVEGLAEVPALATPTRARIRALVVSESGAREVAAIDPRIEIVRGDLRRAEDCARFCADAGQAVVLHCAGLIHPRWIAELFAVNVAGTRNLLAAAVGAGVRRLVAVSSNSPFGGNPDREHRFDEDSPYRPYMAYGRSKMQLEQAVMAAHEDGGLETVLIRAPWFYGPYQPPRQTLFFTMVRDGKAPLVGGGTNLRSMAYIDNLAQGLLLAAGHPAAAGRPWWIADARPYETREIIDTVERLLESELGIGCAHRRLRLPGLAADVARVVDRGLQALGLYQQKIHVLSEMNMHIACSIERARSELGYAPTVALEEGMRRSLRWCRERGLL